MIGIVETLKFFGLYPSQCELQDCTKESFAKKLCRDHYRQWVSFRYPSSRDIQVDEPKKQETK